MYNFALFKFYNLLIYLSMIDLNGLFIDGFSLTQDDNGEIVEADETDNDDMAGEMESIDDKN